MGKVMLSACGYMCDRCRAFHLNVRGTEDQRETAAAWKKYWGIDMLPGQIICDGCHSEPRVERELPGKGCRIKQCVADHGLENCGYCDEYPCETIESTMGRVEKNLESYKDLASPEERAKYFEPYDARPALGEINRGLR